MKKSAHPGKDKIHVLLVADNPIFVFITTRVMQEHDELSIIGSVSREEAVQAESLRPDVILLDLDTSDQTGVEAISSLRSMIAEVGIIALSMVDIASYRQAALQAGADDFVVKSTLNTDLLPAIRRVTHAARPGQGPPAESPQEKKP
jgi:DNA-binding NarL/FixJ family response regulator